MANILKPFKTSTLEVTSSVILPTSSLVSTNNMEAWAYNTKFSVSAQETEPRDIFFKSDGTKMFILGNTGNDITEYNLSTPWSVATATAGNTFSVNAQEPTPYGLYFSPDGLNFYVIGTTADSVYRYTLSTAWNITTATFLNSFSVTAQETDPQAVYFSSTGTKMFVVGTVGDRVYEYNLGTAWDITTATYSNNNISVTALETAPQGLAFNDNGTKLYVGGSTFSRILEYTLPTPWTVVGATLSCFLPVGVVGTDILNNALGGFYYSETGNKFYVVDYGIDAVFEFNTNVPALKITSPNKIIFATDIVGEKNLLIDGHIRSSGSMYSTGTFTSIGTASFGVISANGAITFNTGTSAINIGTSQSTGTVTIGATGQTGTLIFGQSTAAQTLNIGTGATANATTKTINIGTAGVSGSTTNISIGSAVSGSTTNITVSGNLISFVKSVSNVTVNTTTTAVTLDTFNTTSIRTGVYDVQIVRTSDGAVHFEKIIVVAKSTTTVFLRSPSVDGFTEKPETFITSDGALGTFGVSISAGVVTVSFTSPAATELRINVDKKYFTL